ncbi:MAG: hypothetical protein K6A64_03135 [Bacteroidales bacterium]|nr:hypothetical protein [Bacteroidales bacterium]
MKRYLYIVGIIILTTSCDFDFSDYDVSRSDYYFNKKTAEGKGTLSFTIDNIKVNQQTSGGFIYPIHRFAKYSIDDETSIAIINASLISNGYYVSTMPFPEISFTFSSDLLESDAEFNDVETEFWYLLLPAISHMGERIGDANGGIIPHIVDREAEYQLVDVSETKIRIRKWSPEERILAGNFTMTGQYTDSLGVVHPFSVKDGLFDLTDDYDPLSH